MSYFISFEIPGLPPMTNRFGGRHWAKQRRNEWKDLCWVAIRKFLPKHPLIQARITIVRCSSQMPDFDGMVSAGKPIIDSLVSCGVIPDDSLHVIGRPIYMWKRAKQGQGKVLVEILETEDIDIPILE